MPLVTGVTPDDLKRAAAARAVECIASDTVIGLGTGSTVRPLLELLSARLASGALQGVVAVPTSEDTASRCRVLGIPLTTLDEVPFLDLTVDGADEFDDELRLIKGGGGALLREKIVATSSERMIVIADVSKRVAPLGKFPLPVEVVRFGLVATRNMVAAHAAEAGCEGEIKLRLGKDGTPFVTDSGNLLLDCAFGRIDKPEMLDDALKRVPGVVENGLFLGIADVAIVAGADGVVLLERDVSGKSN